MRERLALGTAQFGLPYGIANKNGRISIQDAEAILYDAKDAGLDTLDTAVAYGESEKVLGDIGVKGWKVVTKLPNVSRNCADIRDWVCGNAIDSIKNMRISNLYALLLHHPLNLLDGHGSKIYNALNELKNSGHVQKIGISIYDTSELDAILPKYPVDLVQAPFNVFDRRLDTTGWLDRLCQSGVEVHIRSVFLQGLLLMSPEHRPVYFDRWIELMRNWDTWLHRHSLNAVQVCLGHALSHQGIGRVIVGVDSQSQLHEIVGALQDNSPRLPENLCSEDLELINPSKWRIK